MTKFETILRLAEIRVMLEMTSDRGQVGECIGEMYGLIEELSESFKEDCSSHSQEHTCPVSGATIPNCSHLYARKICIDCGHHHD